jgi:hypothetical protein
MRILYIGTIECNNITIIQKTMQVRGQECLARTGIPRSLIDSFIIIFIRRILDHIDLEVCNINIVIIIIIGLFIRRSKGDQIKEITKGDQKEIILRRSKGYQIKEITKGDRKDIRLRRSKGYQIKEIKRMSY